MEKEINNTDILKEILKNRKENLTPNSKRRLIASVCLLGRELQSGRYEKEIYDRLKNRFTAEETIEKVIRKIEGKYPYIKGDISNILTDFDLSFVKYYEIIDGLEKFKLSKLEWAELNSAFQERIEVSGEGRIGNNSRERIGSTPKEIIALSNAILNPIGGRYYDGACGTGESLTLAYKYSERNGEKIELCGQENNVTKWIVAKLTLALNYIEGDLRSAEFIEDQLFWGEKKFDYVLIDAMFKNYIPDYILEEDLYDLAKYGCVSRKSAALASVFLGISHINKDGKGIFILKDESMTSKYEEIMRKSLLSLNVVECVIELSAGQYEPYTSARATVLVVNMNKNESMRNKVLFINGARMHTRQTSRVSALTENNIEDIVNIYKEKLEIEGVSRILSMEDIDEYNMLPSRYIVENEIETKDFGKVEVNIKKLEELNQGKCLKDVADFYKGINIIKESNNREKEVKIIKISDIKNGEVDLDNLSRVNIGERVDLDSYLVRKGDVIVSNRGFDIKVATINEECRNLVLSQNLIGIRLHENQSPEYIKEFLQSPLGKSLILSKKRGTVIPFIKLDDIKKIPVTDISYKKQVRLMEEYKMEMESIEKSIKELNRKKDNLKMNLYKYMGIEDTFRTI